jgi:hypothetical protein
MSYYGFGEDTGWTIDGNNYIDFEGPKPIQIPAGLTDEKEILDAYFKESKIRELEKYIRDQLYIKLGTGIISDLTIRLLAERAYRGEIEPEVKINFSMPKNPDNSILLTFSTEP